MKGSGTFRRAMTAVGAVLAKPFKRIAEEVKQEAKVAAVAHAKRKEHVRLRSGRHAGYARPKAKGFKLFWGKTPGSACPAPLSRKVLKRICPTHPLLAKGWR
jgi:hypothetical protein